MKQVPTTFILERKSTFNFVSSFKQVSYWFRWVIFFTLYSAAFPFTLDPRGVRHRAGPRRDFREAHDTDAAGPWKCH